MAGTSQRCRLSRPRGRRPSLELLESRCLPSTVTNLADAGPGSLRDAIATTPSGGTVDFQPGLSGIIRLTTGELDITKDVALAGPGSSLITISGSSVSRVLNVAPSLTAAISGLTLADGNLNFVSELMQIGGGILNAGTLSLLGCTVRNNQATTSRPLGANAAGGGIYNSGILTLTDSIVSTNSASGSGPRHVGQGGGIFNSGTLVVIDSTLTGNSTDGTIGSFGGGISNGGTLTVVRSTLSGNFSGGGGPMGIAGGGGGIANRGGSVTISSSTLSGNFVTGNPSSQGGGIYEESGMLTITASTISGNSMTREAGRGGGIFAATVLTVRNSIIAGNRALEGADVSGGLLSEGHNLIGIGDDGDGYAETDLVGTSALPIDPELENLGDYGGPTQTMPPLPGSPVVNAGDNTDVPATDQRSFPRIVLGYVDIGAVELQPSEFGGPGGDAASVGPLFHSAVPASVDPSLAFPGAQDPSIKVPSMEAHYVPLVLERSRLDTVFQHLGGDTGLHARTKLAGLSVKPRSDLHCGDAIWEGGLL